MLTLPTLMAAVNANMLRSVGGTCTVIPSYEPWAGHCTSSHDEATCALYPTYCTWTTGGTSGTSEPVVTDPSTGGGCTVNADSAAYAEFCRTSTTEAMCNTYNIWCSWNGEGATPTDVPATTTAATTTTGKATTTTTGKATTTTTGKATTTTTGRATTTTTTGRATTTTTTTTTRATTTTTRATTTTTRATTTASTTASTTAPTGELIPCIDLNDKATCATIVAASGCGDTYSWWPVEGPTKVVCAETCHNLGLLPCEGGQTPSTTTTTTTTPYPETVAPSDPVLKEVMATLDNGNLSSIFLAEQPDMTWKPSELYQSKDLAVAVRKAVETGVGPLHLFDFNDVAGKTTDQKVEYSLVNIAAFLAQAMQETIRYDACDENNWDFETYSDGRYRAASACGQLNQDYGNYKCGDDGSGIDYECEVDPTMELIATTHAKWWGAPGPMFCGPKSKLPVAPVWTTSGDCTNSMGHPPTTFDELVSNINNGVKCVDYEGQKGGYWELLGESLGQTNDPNGRSDVEGCCWWGRGVIQTTGVCNFGKLNYHLGARAVREGRDALYPDVDFCKRPDLICGGGPPDLKWFAGIFYYISDVQPWNDSAFNYKQAVMDYVDGGYTNAASFIDKVSGIVNRGCPASICSTGPVHALEERRDNFMKVLDAFEL